MKNIFFVILALSLVFALAGCKSSPELSDSSRMPDDIIKAFNAAPADTLVGIGTARLASLSQSMTVAQSRARADISRQMNTMVEDMIRDYQASSEVDRNAALSFQENITVSLSRSNVSGARMVQQVTERNGTVWTVIYLDRAMIVNEITQAQAAARLAVPAMASFDAEARMNEAFARMNTGVPQARYYD